jgi:cell division protein FtsX
MVIFIILEIKVNNMEDDSHIIKCMVKRTGFILQSFFNMKFIITIIVGVISGMCVLIPIIFVNCYIMNIICDIFNISRPIVGIIGLVIWFVLVAVSGMGLFIAIACLSCIPIIEKYSTKFMIWSMGE